MERLLIAVLSCTALSSAGACAEATPLAREVHECEAQRAAACSRIEGRLATLFAGGCGADRLLAERLAAAAVEVLERSSTRGESINGEALEGSLRECAKNDSAECVRVAGVLSGLFTGADARLDSSPDRLLARAFAERLVSVATTGVRRERLASDPSSQGR